MLVPLVSFLIATQPAPVLGEVGPDRVLVVTSREVPEETVGAIYAGLSAAGVAIVGPDERRGVYGAVVTAAQANLDTVKAANLDARSKWRALDFDGAEVSLAKAEQAFFRLPSPKDGFERYAETLLLRAEIALARQDAGLAATELRLLARLDPARIELHPGLYAPALVDAYAAARQANAEAVPGYLTLTPRTERGAEVSASLDQEPIPGVFTGLTSSLRPKEGPHVIVVQAPGRRAFASRIDINAQSPLLLAPFLPSPFAERERSELVKRVRNNDEDALLPLAQRTGATAIVLVGLSATAGAPTDRATLWMGDAGRVDVGDAADPVRLGIAVRNALDAAQASEIDEAEGSNLNLALAGAAALTGAVAVAGMAVGLGIYTYRSGFPGQTLDPIDPIVLPIEGSCCSVPVR